ncbi:LuxR C-terminal-related transcriptional regulator [Haloarcula brevis]|uniref:LuxR C-terminal-related transcriptional regulator n=1 Tax=Haloarcula brevis TaxID=3111453 RepID=UPI00300EA07E
MNQFVNSDAESRFDEFEPDNLLLSELHYEVLKLWATTGLSHEEIANQLDASEDTVHKYLTRRYSKYEDAREKAEKAERTAEFLLIIDPNIPDHLDD